MTYAYATSRAEHYDAYFDVLVSVDIIVRHPNGVKVDQGILDRIAAHAEDEAFNEACE